MGKGSEEVVTMGEDILICPSCNNLYPDGFLVCPEDKTMLLVLKRPVTEKTLDKPGWKCSKCRQTYPFAYLGLCPFDFGRLVFSADASLIADPELDVLAQRYRPVAFLLPRKITDCYGVVDVESGENAIAHILHDHLCWDEKTVLKFFEGAKSLEALDHPLIYKVNTSNFRQCQSPHGMPFYIGANIKGVYLDRFLKFKDPPSAIDSVGIFEKVAEALTYVHEQEMFHGNLTTSSVILLTDDFSNADLQVCDFGIAERLFRDSNMSNATGATKTYNVYGSLSGVSPEILRGSKPSAVADIYSFGCLMYEVLSGAPPLERDGEIFTIMAHLNEVPEPFDEKLQIPEKLEAIVMKCLAKEPTERFQSIDELVTALSDCLD